MRIQNRSKEFDWQVTQNDDYVNLCRQRLGQPLLTWVRQFADIIKSEVDHKFLVKDVVSINDFGCNVGHFYRGIEEFGRHISYKGYDISRLYLSIAKEKYGDDLFELLDFTLSDSLDHIRLADISVVSATLEHVLDYEQAIFNIFKATQSLVIIRTFIGDEPLMEMCRTSGASSDYIIRQFTIDDLINIPISRGWDVSRILDVATEGAFKLVCNNSSVYRRQEVLVFKKGRFQVSSATVE
jgi:SAM-dependent methyltransferase